MRNPFTIAYLGLLLASGLVDTLHAAELGELDVTVVDAETQEPMAARLRITDSLGRSPRIRNVPRQGDDFTFEHTLNMKLKTGRYRFTIDRGPHYQQRTGHLDVNRDGFDQKTLALPRFVDMKKEGWYGGDLLVRRKRDQLPLLLAAEELDVAVVPTWVPGIAFSEYQAKQSHGIEELRESVVDYSGCVVETDGGRLLAANIRGGIDPTAFRTDTLGFAEAVRSREGAHLAVLDSYAWDLPMLVAHGLVDSVAVLNSMQRLDGDAIEHAGRKGDANYYRAAVGVGRYAESTYFHLLNCGLRVSPCAESGSGDCDNPPGYNRVYVACGQDFRPKTWWRNLTRGRVMVSNGPLLRVRVNDELPGHVFKASTGAEVELDVACDLATRQKVEYLEIVKDGLVVESMPLEKWATDRGRLPLVKFNASGWMLVRVVARTENTYRCAMTAPYYVEVGERRRVSKQSARFFLDWVYQRARMIRRMNLDAPATKRRIQQQRLARDFWQELADSANAQ